MTNAIVRPAITIHTDGSAITNPGPGGYAAIMKLNGTAHERVVEGNQPSTTNNRMEMTAALEGLRAITAQTALVTICSDSEYLVQGMTNHLPKWIANGWKTSQKKAVLNQDLWMALKTATRGHLVTWKHVKAHAADPLNNRAHDLAKAQADAANAAKVVTAPAVESELPWAETVQLASARLTAVIESLPYQHPPVVDDGEYDYSPEDEARALAEQSDLQPAGRF